MTTTPPLEIPRYSGTVRFKRARERDYEIVGDVNSEKKSIGKNIVDSVIGDVSAHKCLRLSTTEPIIQPVSHNSFQDPGTKRKARNYDGGSGKSSITMLSAGARGKKHNLCIGWRCDEAGCSELSIDTSSKCFGHNGSQGSDKESSGEIIREAKPAVYARGDRQLYNDFGCVKFNGGSVAKCTVCRGGRRCSEEGCDKLSQVAGGK